MGEYSMAALLIATFACYFFGVAMQVQLGD